MTDLPAQLPHGPVEPAFADDVFIVMGQTRPAFGGHELQFSRTMTILREGSDLTLVNTLRLDDVGLAALHDLGTVKNVVKLGAFHGRDDAFYVERYGATVWAFPGMPHSRGVTTDRELVDAGPLPDAQPFLYETSGTVEGHLLLQRHGGILLSCDSLQNLTGPDEWFDEATTGIMGGAGFFAAANIGPGWMGAADPKRADFERLLELPFRHLISAHGPPLRDVAHAAVTASVERVF